MSGVGATRVFVTGGTGFIGSHFIDLLLARGYQVTALVRSGREQLLASGVEAVIGDLTRAESYREALYAQDLVCHLAAHYKLGPVRRSEMFATNVEGTRTLIDTALGCGVGRILHMSSTAALGETQGREADESHIHNGRFRSYYEQSKHIAHGIALARMAAGAPLSIAIPGGVFGPRDSSVLAQTVRAFARGKLPMQVSTTSRFNLCHVRSVCDGLLKIIEHASTGDSWILSGANVSMPELFDALAAHYKVSPPRCVPASRLRIAASLLDRLARVSRMDMPLSSEALQVMDGSTYTYSSGKARAQLHWHPGDFQPDLAAYLTGLDADAQAR